MNFLLVSDDGAKAPGLDTLEKAIRAVYIGANIVSATTKDKTDGRSMSIKATREVKEIPVARDPSKQNRYVVDGTPADVVYRVMMNQREFFGGNSVDYVFSGLNWGANVGMDVFHSGTVGQALIAATFYGIPAVACSQHIKGLSKEEALKKMTSAGRVLAAILEDQHARPLIPGDCINVNLPVGAPKGVKMAPISQLSRYRELRTHQSKVVDDIALLEEGVGNRNLYGFANQFSPILVDSALV